MKTPRTSVKALRRSHTSGVLLSVFLVASAALLAAELVSFRGGLLPGVAAGKKPGGAGAGPLPPGVGVLLIIARENLSSSVTFSVNHASPGNFTVLVPFQAAAPIAHLQVYLLEHNLGGRPIALYTNASGMIRQLVGQGVFDVYGGNDHFNFSATVQTFYNVTTTLAINVNQVTHPVSFFELNDSDHSGRVDTWETVSALVPGAYSYSGGERVYLGLTGSQPSNPLNATASGYPTDALFFASVSSSVPTTVAGVHAGVSGTWLLLKPARGFPVGDYSACTVTDYEPSFEVHYSNG